MVVFLHRRWAQFDAALAMCANSASIAVTIENPSQSPAFLHNAVNSAHRTGQPPPVRWSEYALCKMALEETTQERAHAAPAWRPPFRFSAVRQAPAGIRQTQDNAKGACTQLPHGGTSPGLAHGLQTPASQTPNNSQTQRRTRAQCERQRPCARNDEPPKLPSLPVQCASLTHRTASVSFQPFAPDKQVKRKGRQPES
jgi:hypothetical protein